MLFEGCDLLNRMNFGCRNDWEEVNNCRILFLPDTLGRKNHADMKLVAIVLCTIFLFPWPPLTVLMHRPSPLKVWLITLRSDLEQGTSSRVASAAEPPAMGLITTLLLCTHTASLCTYRQDITRTREPAKTNAYMPCMCVSLTRTRVRTPQV